ncbi:hypothetical protein [Tunicatimonas pelagia]|uniref:hypothetical protein n=1 Tax=Tunicatimonas pelagia TaxID=931531 RepID=UPI002665D3B5|nr:hypothetical protein [Tunicatimonas pelagia]WKN41846.1 hypothetical protein P0M28_22665 [Tunicatimonas pelagia]
MVDENHISVIDASERIGVNKQTLFKWIKKLGLETTKSKNSSYKGQAISYVEIGDFEKLFEYKQQNEQNYTQTQNSSKIDHGVFYLVQLEPEFDPGRFKLGFATNIAERLRSHKCSAPFAKIIETWPAHTLWERTAIDSVTRGCEKLYTEVFRTDNIEKIKIRCNEFFALMPNLDKIKR